MKTCVKKQNGGSQCLYRFLVLGWLLVLIDRPVNAEASQKISLLAPFRAGGNDGLHNLVLIPGMESAITGGKGTLRVDLASELNHNQFRETVGPSGIRIEAETVESRARLAWGVLEYLDLSAEMTATAYTSDFGIIINNVSFYDKVGGDLELTDPVLAAKFQFWGGERPGTGLALRPAIKPVIGDFKDVHSSDAIDYAIGLLGTLDLDWGVWHANVNYTWVGDDGFFPQAANAELKDTVSFGLSYMFEIFENKLAGGVQVFGYLNSFRDEDVNLVGFETAPVSVLLGTRWYPLKHFSIEAAIGPGITSDASDFSAFVNLSYQR